VYLVIKFYFVKYKRAMIMMLILHIETGWHAAPPNSWRLKRRRAGFKGSKIQGFK
jgi:hypothetical protein